MQPRRRTAAQLERKRANDREGQKLNRQRKKQYLQSLETELSSLRKKVDEANAASVHSQAISLGSPDTSSAFSSENLQYRGSEFNYFDGNIFRPYADSGSAWSRDLVPTPQAKPASRQPDLGHLCTCGVPAHTRDECFEIKAYQILCKAHCDISEDPSLAKLYPKSPSLTNLLLLKGDDSPLNIAIRTLLKRSLISGLTDTVASYFIIYRLFRWRLNPIETTYKDVPAWYRPTPLQNKCPHSLFVDFMPWPFLRDYILLNYDTIDWLSICNDASRALTVSWCEQKPFLIKDATSGSACLHPDFERHVSDFSNWRLHRQWAEKYPDLVSLVNLVDE